MTKSILLSIKPKECANIMNGKQTIEVRKKFPKDYTGWVYIYCTKEDRDILSPMMLNNDKKGFGIYSKLIKGWHKYSPSEGKYNCSRCFADIDNLNGKVVARFYCDKVKEITDNDDGMTTKILSEQELLEKSCLSEEELVTYLPFSSLSEKGEWVLGYAIHISNLEIFNRPKELSEFKHYKKFSNADYAFPPTLLNITYTKLLPLTKAPQNYCYVKVENGKT